MNQPKHLPQLSYWKSGDPCFSVRTVASRLTELNVIRTKRLTDDFINLCLLNKNRIFVHLELSGMGKTVFEPHISSIRETFKQLKKLLSFGFSQKQILIIVKPIIPNDNGLRAIELLLKLFTEFRDLRLRFIRFEILPFHEKFIANKNISKRLKKEKYDRFVTKSEFFWKRYYELTDSYKTIISIDTNKEELCGNREIMAISNNKLNKTMINQKVNIISNSHPIRCANKCLLCPHRDH